MSMKYIDKGTVETQYWNIHIAGDIQTAREYTRKFAFKLGFCVQLIPCEYIYTGGLESGMCARIIQYPRFPKEEVYLNRDVLNYAKGLAEELCQKSFTIERNNDTIYYESDEPLHKK
ncbi:hypothetical protein ACQ29_gp044 [Escherichia phage PBECO4]|uniref:Uncharacterized protein n=1 Tax=Escherichia phage PBECO4 TaxID=1273738 RepID=L7TIJ4_9CAUD|nr:hypothetical protein ACQ29_gp044 [Escherichia phage PBECO4]AGC34724.1 hypothetical protein [Escherichia phage PBECO4]